MLHYLETGESLPPYSRGKELLGCITMQPARHELERAPATLQHIDSEKGRKEQIPRF